MSNLGDGIYEKGYNHAKRESSIEHAKNLLNKTKMNDEEISEMVSGELTSEEVGKLRKGEDFS